MEALILVTILLLPINFMPTIVAHFRQHRNRMAITVSNILISIFGIFLLVGFGSLGLLALVGGWMVTLIWACTSNVEPKAA